MKSTREHTHSRNCVRQQLTWEKVLGRKKYDVWDRVGFLINRLARTDCRQRRHGLIECRAELLALDVHAPQYRSTLGRHDVMSARVCVAHR